MSLAAAAVIPAAATSPPASGQVSSKQPHLSEPADRGQDQRHRAHPAPQAFPDEHHRVDDDHGSGGGRDEGQGEQVVALFRQDSGDGRLERGREGGPGGLQ
ncbi:hypothetical protein [Streptomyces atriruber]|uniref:hypothetical protein n=1 Tax=Streptomyces atriruber TaxID=545121 RepID=UPI0006E3E007|nr:hypothetical protein [Streptomyces atriruber]